jgi:hypothetical protein
MYICVHCKTKTDKIYMYRGNYMCLPCQRQCEQLASDMCRKHVPQHPEDRITPEEARIILEVIGLRWEPFGLSVCCSECRMSGAEAQIECVHIALRKRLEKLSGFRTGE